MSEQDSPMAKYALLAVMSTSFMVTFMGSSINLALPTIGAEFNSSAIMTSWIITSYLLSSAALLLPFGHLADILGRRKIYLLGTIAFSLVTFLSTLAQTASMLILCRVLQGISSAMIFGTGMAILTAVYPPQKRGQALGLSTAVTYTGLSIGPVLGGIMNQNLGWRSIFYLTAIIGLTASMLIFRRLHSEWSGSPDGGFDARGSFFYMLGISAFLYGLSSLSNVEVSKFIAAGGLVLLVVFILIELRTAQPILQASLFLQNRTFTFSNVAALINYSATFAVTFLLSLYLQVVKGYTSQHAGIILLVQPVTMAVFSPLSGSISDRIAPRIVASLGMGLSAVGLFGLVFLHQEFPLWALICLQVTIGLGFALFSSPNTNAVMSSVHPRFYGIASSTLGTMRLIGQAMSMAVVTMIIAVYLGRAALSPASAPSLLSSMHTSFAVFTALCSLGVLASLARGHQHPAPKEVVDRPSGN